MQIFKQLLVTVSMISTCFFYTAKSNALPENELKLNRETMIQKQLLADTDLAQIKKTFAQTGVPKLDALWNSAETVRTGVCSEIRNDCRVLSVFRRSAMNNRPVVLLPGFTGYRQMFIEQVSDLLDQGFGPIYVSDYTGTGDSHKPELQPGQKPRLVADVLAEDPLANRKFAAHVTELVGAKKAPKIMAQLSQLPIGIGYIRNFNRYTKDVDFVMNVAVQENPDKKILVTALSMSGLTVLEAIAHQAQEPAETAWISHVDRVILESPMLRLKSTDQLGLHGVGGIVQIIAKVQESHARTTPMSAAVSVPEFVDKALAHYNPKNLLSHSPNRLTLIDSVRVWNDHETLGATWGWAYQELKHQYSTGPLDKNIPVSEPLNAKEDAISSMLFKNQIRLIVVASEADAIVDTHATKLFLSELAMADLDLHLCLFKTARHQIDQESDRYRDPYMQVLFDQLNPAVRKLKHVYGREPRHEQLRCQRILLGGTS